MDHADCVQEILIYSDTSEHAYGCVGYLRTEDPLKQVEVAFLTARSQVAPKKQLSMPRLELCAALTGTCSPVKERTRYQDIYDPFVVRLYNSPNLDSV